MIPDKLKLRGFKGIREGMGLDEIEIDFSGLTGLVALAGDNGTGKTTVLENMHGFRTMPSKKSSLYRQVFLRDSYRDFSFWFEGVHYRTLVKIDAQSEKSEGYIWKNHNDQKSEVDGKVSNYDPYITNLLGSSNLFFNSIFAAQKSKKISGLTTGKLQELFSEFLRLYELIAYETTSKQCITVLGTVATRIDKEIDALEVKIMDKAETERKLSEAVEKESSYLKEQIELTEKIKDAETNYEKAKEAIAKSMVKKGRLSNFEQNLARFKNDRDRELESVESELNRLRIKLRGINDEIAKCESLLKDKDKIMEACQQKSEIVEKLPAIEKDIEQKKKELDKADSEINEITKTVEENRRIIDAGKKDPEIARLEAEISGKREKTVDLEKRSPICNVDLDTEKENACGFITGALRAQEELPLLEKKLSDRMQLRSEQAQKANRTMEECDVKLVSLKKKKGADAKNYNAVVDEKYALNEKLKKIRLFSVKKPDVAVAMSQKDSLEKRKDGIISEGIRIRDNRDKSIARIDDETKKLNTEIEELKDSIDNTLDEKKEKAERQLNESKLALEGTDKQIVDTRERIAVLKQSVAEKCSAEKDMVDKKKEHAKLMREQGEWIYLRNACGKDGLRQLELDCVAPLINGYANELLNMSFESNDLVKLLTQDEEGREDIKIVVLREEEVLLDDLCGGEEVIILKALRLAMTLISQEKSGRRYESIFCDEEDGALSVENAIKFIYLYKSLMKIAEIDTCFYISHKPQCVAMADHVLNFGNGGITID